MVNEHIKLSHSLAEAFCPQQEYLKRVVGLKDNEKYDFAKGHLAEYLVQEYLAVERTGCSLVNLRDAGLTYVEKLANKMEHEEHRRLMTVYEDLLQGVINYCKSIDYKTIHVSQRFYQAIKGFTRYVTGEWDIEAERDGKPLIIDIKYQEKPLTMKDFTSWKKGWVRQLGLYGMIWMRKNNTVEAPLLEVHVIVKNGEPLRFPIDLTEDLLYEVLDNMHNLNLRLDADYWPMNREHKLCNPRFCHVYGYCHSHNRLDWNNILDRLEENV